MKLIFAPDPLEISSPSVFLAGSIDNGSAIDWQTSVTAAFADTNYTVLNPRRPDRDDSWSQDASDRQFNQQVTWELDALDAADLILFYIAPGSASPISLLELGLYARSKKVIMCCPPGFYRKGNVDIVCQRYGIMQIPDISDKSLDLVKMILGVITTRI
jgi:hypothetical protein